MSRIRTSDVLGALLAVASWILVALIVAACLHALLRCGWLCLDGGSNSQSSCARHPLWRHVQQAMFCLTGRSADY